jgi:hypothetical protein
MWNSNSVISWLIVRSGLDIDTIELPSRGRAPGSRAGIVVARRQGSRRFTWRRSLPHAERRCVEVYGLTAMPEARRATDTIVTLPARHDRAQRTLWTAPR